MVKTKALCKKVVFLLIFGLLFLNGNAFSAESYKTKLIGHSDLQGRPTLQVTLRGDYAYCGHHRGEAYNPMTGEMEHNGTTIVNVSNPEKPVIVKHIPGAKFAESRAVQVVYNFQGKGKDYLIRNQETFSEWYFEIWDITNKKKPAFVSKVDSTPAGRLTLAHKGWWDADSGFFFGSANEPGFRDGHQHLIIWDLKNPKNPVYVSSGWIKGQKKNEPHPGERLSLHHPIVDFANKRVYGAYLFGGDVVVWDISDIQKPKVILHKDYVPPFEGTHTAVPFFGIKTPNFSLGYGDIRNYIVISEENFAEDCEEMSGHIFILDVTAWENPVNVAAYKVPQGDFCRRGGRFGPHQFAETKDGKFLSPKDNNNLIYEAYFNAGLRIIDLSDPFNPKEAGYYIPDTSESSEPRPSSEKRAIASNDVDLDYRGLAYVTDRYGAGLHIIKYLGEK